MSGCQICVCQSEVRITSCFNHNTSSVCTYIHLSYSYHFHPETCRLIAYSKCYVLIWMKLSIWHFIFFVALSRSFMPITTQYELRQFNPLQCSLWIFNKCHRESYSHSGYKGWWPITDISDITCLYRNALFQIVVFHISLKQDSIELDQH